ncbi:MAG: hypothetical protein EB078_04205 [Proteobacteria bacterium]|nr:hypothetical protein [Pseudomonadota bacterium]NDD04087.1 hypothetical protein [Pseudomonadota bacterium]NDG26635.1 hypothetical protein [Pseudomonadota bacterium]
MAWFVFFQMLFNLGLIATGYWFYTKKKFIFSQQSQSPTQTLVEEWKKNWEAERQNSEQQLAIQLRSMRNLYDQTKRLLEEKQALLSPFPASQEEREIKSFVQEKAVPEIPTLADFELEKERLKQESPLDLRTILKEQLC